MIQEPGIPTTAAGGRLGYVSTLPQPPAVTPASTMAFPVALPRCPFPPPEDPCMIDTIATWLSLVISSDGLPLVRLRDAREAFPPSRMTKAPKPLADPITTSGNVVELRVLNSPPASRAEPQSTL